jgi:hypothetical protein
MTTIKIALAAWLVIFALLILGLRWALNGEKSHD